MRKELIQRALEERFDELCGERVQALDPSSFGGPEYFVREVRGLLLDASPASLREPGPAPLTSPTWATAEGGCLANLSAIALGEEVKADRTEPGPVGPFMKELVASRADSSRRFNLIYERYYDPFSFTRPAEDGPREYVLARLMSQDRARVEGSPLKAPDADDLLLRLNLVAVHALADTDLRFLDALNYYYELLPADYRPVAQHDWLLASYYALYARALAARI